MSLTPASVQVYHVFLASPGDVAREREAVRQFFNRVNTSYALNWKVRFEVVDWENYHTIGVGRPQELITRQTLERFRDSLALVVGLMWQRFGTPTGKFESGTEEEFTWAWENNRATGFPEIKWFFRKVEQFIGPADPKEMKRAAEQWEKVHAFRERLKGKDQELFFGEYPDPDGFRTVFEADLSRWLSHPDRPWVPRETGTASPPLPGANPPDAYYEALRHDFRRLDIAGIDNDKSFEIPLEDVYVRLRVKAGEETTAGDEAAAPEGGPIDIQTALARYQKLVIVGDPGSGKSTFLKYIALMLARAHLDADPTLALTKLSLPEPLPVPVFLSCWDLSDFLKETNAEARVQSLRAFISERLRSYGFALTPEEVGTLLESGRCCVLFDGLDEVPTDRQRAVVSRLLEECVAKYGANRYVVTSRVRAYTGDTILKGEFARCDIEPFDANDRAQFVRNWVRLLFRLPADTPLEADPAARQEFAALTASVEGSDRIRRLADNPLLMTVVAIVHWNRKRLPEQRVDLYDECVDVLLGQRKDAERALLTRKVAAADEQREGKEYADRAWVRKRFAEIALHILTLDADKEEASRADVVKLLAPRFRDTGATTDEQAESLAQQFLDKQELRSGLLVSRRAQSCRFVHLTFQEYLAAWHLSNLEFDRVCEVIGDRLREPKWFEALQLLGGEWAKQSDDKLDQYVAWLLAQQGTTIPEKAPIVALCANIARDVASVAKLNTETRGRLARAIEETLDAFNEGSRISLTVQLEILHALAQLGAMVKDHLINATNASLFSVRREAIELLLPHLSEDELFRLTHILDDRSWVPVAFYLNKLLEPLHGSGGSVA